MAKKNRIEVDTNEIQVLLSEKMYQARQDAWLSACEWIISLKVGEDVNCERAFKRYIESLAKD